MIGLIFALFASASYANTKASISEVYQKAIAVNASTALSPKEKGVVLSEIYKKGIPNATEELSISSVKDLRILMRLTDMVNAYSKFQGAKKGRSEYIWNNLKYFKELARRGVTNQEDVENIYDQLIRERLFSVAAEVRLKYGQSFLPLTPKIKSYREFDPSLPAVMRLASDGHTWVLENPGIRDRPYQILVVAQCHIADKAAREIAADPVLSRAFKDAIWVESAGEPLESMSIAQWNKSFPNENLSIAYDNSLWSGVDFSLSPNFYILKHGSVAANLTGWSKTTGKRDLIEWLSTQGVSAGN